MPRININFGDAAEGYVPIPEGLQPIVTEKVEIRQAEGAPYPYLNWDLRIIQGDFEGRHLFLTTSLSPKSLFRLYDNLEALRVIPETFDPKTMNVGVDYDDQTFIVNRLMMGDTPVELLGITAYAQVFQETYNRRIQSKVDYLIPVEASAQGVTVSGSKPSQVISVAAPITAPAAEGGETTPQARRISLK